MKHEIIKTENYLIIVSDDKLNEGDFMYRRLTGIVKNTPDYYFDFKVPYKKIIAHLPLNYAPYLDGVDVLPEVDKYYQSILNNFIPNKIDDSDEEHFYDDGVAEGINIGYNKSKEIYKYTEYDLRRAMTLVEEIVEHQLHMDEFHTSSCKCEPPELDTHDKIIEALNKSKLPIAFISDPSVFDPQLESYLQTPYKPKTIKTLRGTEWVGTYIFNN